MRCESFFVWKGEKMKIWNWNKIGNVVRNWKLGDYLRQLSIVVLGIVITFLGSDWISNQSRQKEVRAAMQLVIEELKYNKLQLKQFENEYGTDCRMALMLISHDFDSDRLPIDTLQKYERFVTSIYTFSYTTDALEVLKSSSLMQQISDKRLLLDMLHTYNKLKITSAEIKSYCDMKEEVLFSFSLSMDENEQIKSSKSLEELYRTYFSKNKVRNFCFMVPGYLDEDWCSSAVTSIDQCIRTIEAMYH